MSSRDRCGVFAATQQRALLKRPFTGKKDSVILRKPADAAVEA
jgi:hypothetical protein